MFKYLIALFLFIFTTTALASNYDDPRFNRKGFNKYGQFIAQIVKEADGDLLETIVMISIESNFTPTAVNTKTNAAGFTQFMGPTWRQTLRTFGHKYNLPMDVSPKDPRANLLMAIEHHKDNRRYLERRLGREVQMYEVQLAHFLGQGGSTKMIRANGNRLARDVLPNAAAYNPSYFYKNNGQPRTVAEFKSFYKRKLDTARSVYLAETYLLAFQENLYFKDAYIASL